MPVAVPDHTSRQEGLLSWCVRAAVAVVLVFSVLNWVGWATGNDSLTRIFPSWPHMSPWSAVIQAALAVAILVQLGRPSPTRLWAGRGLAAMAGLLAAVFVAENATGRSFGLDQVFFSDTLAATQEAWPGRPSMWTAASAALLAVLVAVIRLDRRWTRVAWPVFLAAAAVLPTVTALRDLFEAVLLLDATRAGGQSLASVLSLLLLVAAAQLMRPDRVPLAWLLSRPDRWTLLRMVGILAGLPLAVGLSRLLFLKVGLHGDTAWVLSITVGTVITGVGVFFASWREQGLLIDKERISRERAEAERERAEAEALYRTLLEAAPDALIIVGTDGRIMIANAQADTMFGYSRDDLVGSEVERLVPPRFRVKHVQNRMDFFADAALRPMGAGLELWGLHSDGTEFPVSISLSPLPTSHGLHVLAAIRDVTERHEYEQRLLRQHGELVVAHEQLDQLARCDSLTGLVNRAQVLARLDSATTCSRTPGTELGVLFCDVDRFKTINDTYGHSAGDAVLCAVADRISQCVRHGDTVGRVGGDEIMVLLPGLHSRNEATQIAEKIRARNAEPMHHSENTFHAKLSIGATLALPGESASDATARADAAMYQSKRAGGNSVTFI